MKEHYYIVKWSKAGGWEIDTDTEEARFPDGTVWNGQEWEFAYEGEGVFNDNNDLVTQDLEVILSQANEREGERCATTTGTMSAWGVASISPHITDAGACMTPITRANGRLAVLAVSMEYQANTTVRRR